MNDLLDDDLLRAALHAEVDALDADDDLLDRIQGARPTVKGRAVRWLLLAAAVAVAVGLFASLALDDDAAEVTTLDDPTTTVLATTSTIPPPQGGRIRPARVALVREDGRLVLIEIATGAERELAFHGDPRDTQVEGGPSYIDAVERSPDGQWVYYSTCCEPAVGTTYRVSTDGGQPERVADGAYPSLSPDGRYLAVSHAMGVAVLDLTAGLQTVATIGLDEATQLQCCVGRTAWSPDGTQLAYLAGTGEPGTPRQAGLLDFDGSSLVVADTGKPDNPGSFISWNEDGMLTISSGGPIDDDRSLSQDVTYHWLLWVDEAGVVRQQDGFQTGDRTPIDGLPKAIAADW